MNCDSTANEPRTNGVLTVLRASARSRLLVVAVSDAAGVLGRSFRLLGLDRRRGDRACLLPIIRRFRLVTFRGFVSGIGVLEGVTHPRLARRTGARFVRSDSQNGRRKRSHQAKGG
jgi:hypothetical protein